MSWLGLGIGIGHNPGGVAGGGAPFVPSSLFGAGDIGYAWDPTDLTKVWQSNAGTTAGAFTSVVGRLTDISGKGNNLNSELDDGRRPVLQNVNNGMVKFDGVDDFLAGIGGFYAAGACTVAMAINNAASGANFFWAEASTSSGVPIYGPGTRQNTADVFNYQRNDANSPIANSVVSGIFDGTTHVLIAVDTGSSVAIYKDGALQNTNTYTRNGPLTVNASSLGAGGDGVGAFFNYSPAYIGAGTVIGRALNGTEITNLNNWIKARHGL